MLSPLSNLIIIWCIALSVALARVAEEEFHSTNDTNDRGTTCYGSVDCDSDGVDVMIKIVEEDTSGPDAWTTITSETLFSTPVEVGPVISICCKPGHYFEERRCLNGSPEIDVVQTIFPKVYDSNLVVSSMRHEDFTPRYGNPCPKGGFSPLAASYHDALYLLDNGTIETNSTIYRYLNENDYCLGNKLVNNRTSTFVFACLRNGTNSDTNTVRYMYAMGLFISAPFFAATFFVYAIIPELRNLPGLTLLATVGSMCLAYGGLGSVMIFGGMFSPGHSVCISIAFIIHFSFLSSFFWLNVMCFDIWWTFGGFRSMQGSVKQRERKKFIFYSIYAWGSATLLTGVCLIMDFVPSVPKNFIKPGFGVQSCWFATNGARALYFYGPIGVTVICNIFLFISTTIKIIQHKKDTAHHLKGIDSRRHDDNKQWFNLYLKLFIVMGINWSMEIISWLFNGTPHYFWYITDLANTLQGLIIFIIFVWKDKTKKLLLKRLGFKDPNFQSHNSTRSAYLSSGSKTCTTNLTPVTAPLQEKINPFVERTKTTTDESDGV